ncbi:MAG: glycosyltransferase family 1 protein, partial [Ferruginibacter sp.]
MNIGYDGKRAFQNRTGLGNYIRSLLAILTRHYPRNHYTLFAPRQTDLFDVTAFENVEAIFPETFAGKKFPGWWRRNGMVKAIEKSGMNIYHGVSNELPLNIERTVVKTVVTIHDIIFERFPETYHFDERIVHRWKIKQACKVADAIIAISKQTKEDLVNLYDVEAEKIFVCYQSCNPIFQQVISEENKAIVKSRYNLPGNYFLFVGRFIPDKGLHLLVEAYSKLTTNKKLVLIGGSPKAASARITAS